MSEQVSQTGPEPGRRVVGLRPSSRHTPRSLCVLAFAAASLATAAPQGRAANLFASGDQARQLCTESPEWCVGFVTGALDGWAALEAYFTGEKFCIPTDLPVGQIVEAFRHELERRPEPREDPAAYFLFETLIADHPCPAAPELRSPGAPAPDLPNTAPPVAAEPREADS